jgi:hypothetical protein
MGAVHGNETDDAWLAFWTWANPRHVIERERILRQADAGGLGHAWIRDTSVWGLLMAKKRLMEFDEHAAATSWLIQRLEELKRAEMFALLSAFGTSADEPEGSADAAP